MSQPTITSLQLEIKNLEDKLQRDHANLKGGLIEKMQYQREIREQLLEAALRLKVLPSHADTHKECYSDTDLIAALVKEIERLQS